MVQTFENEDDAHDAVRRFDNTEFNGRYGVAVTGPLAIPCECALPTLRREVLPMQCAAAADSWSRSPDGLPGTSSRMHESSSARMPSLTGAAGPGAALETLGRKSRRSPKSRRSSKSRRSRRSQNGRSGRRARRKGREGRTAWKCTLSRPTSPTKYRGRCAALHQPAHANTYITKALPHLVAVLPLER